MQDPGPGAYRLDGHLGRARPGWHLRVFAVVEAGQPGGSVYRDILAALAIGMLMDAFLVCTLLVPSTVALLGRWNW
jgi:hypothetical protein